MKVIARPLVWVAALAGLGTAACGAERSASSSEQAVRATEQKAETMKIRLRIGGRIQTATLADSAAARDFASLLPLTLTLEEYNSTEKVADLPRKLSLEGAPEGYDPLPGDITHFAPWGNLAIFYRDFGYSRGLVHLGTIEGGTAAFEGSGPVQVTIERAE